MDGQLDGHPDRGGRWGGSHAPWRDLRCSARDPGAGHRSRLAGWGLGTLAVASSHPLTLTIARTPSIHSACVFFRGQHTCAHTLDQALGLPPSRPSSPIRLFLLLLNGCWPQLPPTCDPPPPRPPSPSASAAQKAPSPPSPYSPSLPLLLVRPPASFPCPEVEVEAGRSILREIRR